MTRTVKEEVLARREKDFAETAPTNRAQKEETKLKIASFAIVIGGALIFGLVIFSLIDAIF